MPWPVNTRDVRRKTGSLKAGQHYIGRAVFSKRNPPEEMSGQAGYYVLHSTPERPMVFQGNHIVSYDYRPGSTGAGYLYVYNREYGTLMYLNYVNLASNYGTSQYWSFQRSSKGFDVLFNYNGQPLNLTYDMIIDFQFLDLTRGREEFGGILSYDGNP